MNFAEVYFYLFLFIIQFANANAEGNSQLGDFPLSFGGGGCQLPRTNNDLLTCKYKAIMIHEKTSYSAPFYKTITIYYNESINCLEECAKDTNCRAMLIKYNPKFQQCLLSDNDKGRWLLQKPNQHLVKVECCKMDDKKLRDTTKLLVLYDPTKLCESVSSRHVKACTKRIWHVEDGVGIKTGLLIEQLIGDRGPCLDYCLETYENCVGVTFDVQSGTCFFSAQKEIPTKFKNYHKISFTLQCCNRFKEEYTEGADFNTVKTNISYPIVSHPEDCPLLPTNKSPNLPCKSKAWHPVKDVRITNNALSVKSSSNIGTCLEYCLNTPKCTAISKSIYNDKSCYIQNGDDITNETVEGFISYFLNCCDNKQQGKGSVFGMVMNSNHDLALTNDAAANGRKNLLVFLLIQVMTVVILCFL